MNWLVILTQQDGSRLSSITRHQHFRAGTTRRQVIEWAGGQARMPSGSIVLFFYAEPDEVTS